jgi:hypothetical protein
MITLLVAIYRAWPLRPHCNSQAGVHTFLCRLIVPHLGMDLCPNTHPGALTCGDSTRPSMP